MPEASINDLSNEREQYESQKDKLDDLQSPNDAEAIRAWTVGRSVKFSTRNAQLHRVRLLSKRSMMHNDLPLVDMTSETDVNALLETFENGTHPDIKEDGLAESTLRQFKIGARNFFRDGLEREWAEDIKVGASPEGKVSRDDCLTTDESAALRRAATRSRDKAMISTLLATGQRITALLTLRVGDVDLSGRDGTIHLNEDALGLKGASGPRPLIWATADMENWLASHPRREDDDAALFCTLQSGHGGNHDAGTYYEYEPGEPLTRMQAFRRLKQVAEDAGIDTDKVTPHNFRHTAITRMLEDGVPEQHIKWLVGWHKDSSQLDRYAHVDDDKMMNGVREHFDRVDPEESDVGHPDLSECPRTTCDTAIPPGSQFCPGCSMPLSQKAADEIEDTQEQAVETMADPDTTDEERQAARAIIDAVDDPMALADELSGLNDG